MLGFGIQITPPPLSFCFVLSKIEIGKWMEGKACDNLSNIFGAKPCKTNYHSIISRLPIQYQYIFISYLYLLHTDLLVIQYMPYCPLFHQFHH